MMSVPTSTAESDAFTRTKADIGSGMFSHKIAALRRDLCLAEIRGYYRDLHGFDTVCSNADFREACQIHEGVQ